MSDPSTAVADWRTRTVRQCADLCVTCIYRPGNLAHLAPGRVQEMTQAAIANEGHVVCHAVRREAPCCIPDSIGRNLEDHSWVA